MDKGELQLILKEGEGYKVEFKESLSNIDRELVAFANSSGGKILLGVTDEGAVKGISATNELKSRIQDIANNCRPKVRITLEVSHDVLIITVLESEDKPCECSSGFYKRIGANSQKMTRNEIIDFFKSEGKVRFDELLETRCNYPKDFDRGKLSAFSGLAGLSRSLKAETILHSLDVTEKQDGKLYFNNAGVLFFAKEPQRFISWSVFTVVLFKDKNGVDVIDRKELSGSLFEIVDSVMDFVRLYAKVAYRFTGKPQREEIYEYPFEAIREAVINSVMHKDYFERGHNNIQSAEYLNMAGKETKFDLLQLNERQKKGLEYITKTGKITTKVYIDLTGTIRRTAIRDLADMVDKKVLKIGGSKLGKLRYYSLM